MKLSLRLAFILFVYSTSSSSFAQKADDEKETVDMKCYVELVGGGNTILYHHRLPKKNKASFDSILLSIFNNSAKRNSEKSIYKVGECAEIKDKFKLGVANTLEQNIAR